jgi:kinesin family protein 14
LAGSERCSKANTSGKQLLEGCAINKSLLTLGQVISSLQSNADIQQTPSLQKDTKRHVPWRQSKLTLILKEVLENSCSTCFVLCASSRKEEGAETLSTLQFGSQLMNVRIRVSSDNRSPKTLAMRPISKKSEIAMQNCNAALQSGLYHKGTLAQHVPLLRILIFVVLLVLFIVQCLVVFL